MGPLFYFLLLRAYLPKSAMLIHNYEFTKNRGGGHIAKKIPWEDIKNDYIRGCDNGNGRREFPSQRDLAAKYNVAPASIGRRASKEQWALQREQFASKVSAMTQQKAAELISDESCGLNLKIYNTVSSLADRIQEYSFLGDLTPGKLSRLAAALKNVQSIAAANLGDKTAEDQALEIQVRLESDPK